MTNKNEIQVGIVSAGDGCAKANTPAIYARVSAYESWIRETICNISDFPPTNCNDPTSAPIFSPSTPPAPAPAPAPSVTTLPTTYPIPDVTESDVPSQSDVPSSVPTYTNISDPPSFAPTICIRTKSPIGKGKGKGGLSGKGMMRMEGKGGGGNGSGEWDGNKGKGKGGADEPSSKDPKYLCPKSKKSNKGKGMRMGKGGMDMGKGGMIMGKGMRMGKGGMGIGKIEKDSSKIDTSKKGTEPTTEELMFLEYLSSLRAVDSRGGTANNTSDFESIVNLILSGQSTELNEPDGSTADSTNGEVIPNDNINDHITDRDISVSILARTAEKAPEVADSLAFESIVAHERPLHTKIDYRSGKNSASDPNLQMFQDIVAHERPVNEPEFLTSSKSASFESKEIVPNTIPHEVSMADEKILDIVSHERPMQLVDHATVNKKSHTTQIEEMSGVITTENKLSALDLINEMSEGSESLNSMKIIGELIAGHELHQ
jgi:Trypsin